MSTERGNSLDILPNKARTQSIQSFPTTNDPTGDQVRAVTTDVSTSMLHGTDTLPAGNRVPTELNT